MTYAESAKGLNITRARAKIELQKHGVECDWDLFLAEVGDKQSYKASSVLEWLGY